MGNYIIMIMAALVLIGSYYVIKKGKDFFDKSVKLNDWKDGDKSRQC